jgi:hypothetical protein
LAREEKSPIFFVPEKPDHLLGEAKGLGQVTGFKTCLIQVKKPVDEKGVIFNGPKDGGLPLSVTVEETPIRANQFLKDEIRSLLGRFKVLGIS